MDVEELVKNLRRSIAEQAERVAEQEDKLVKDQAFLAELEARLESVRKAPTEPTPAASDSTERTPAGDHSVMPMIWPRNGVLTKVDWR